MGDVSKSGIFFRASHVPNRRRNLASDLLATLNDEVMSDVVLVGFDGIRVPAFRFVLGARSNVFRRMLYGPLKVSQHRETDGLDEVQIDYSGTILRAVVEFCCTDRVSEFDHRADEVAVRDIVHLFEAACFLELGPLQKLARDMLCVRVDSHRPLACAAYDEATSAGHAEDLASFALSTIRSYPKTCLLSKDESRGGGVASLRPTAMREIIRDDKIQAREVTLFHALKRWADDDTREWPREVKVADVVHQPCEDKFGFARKLLEEIDLSGINPSDLLGVVGESGLVDSDLIQSTVQKQALRAEKEGFSFSKYRSS